MEQIKELYASLGGEQSGIVPEVTQAFLITGQTYTSRREIKAIGGKWNPDKDGWIVPASQEDKARRLSDVHGFHIESTEVDPILLEHPTGERLRAIRQDKLDRRSARKIAQAERLEKISDQEAAKVTKYDDYAFWTQPILVGHHSEKSHRALRDRLSNSMSKSARLYNEAQELRAEATPTTARIAGDAERQREIEREALDRVLTVGSRVLEFAFGEGTIVRVNKKTYTVQYDRGCKYARDKTYFRPL